MDQGKCIEQGAPRALLEQPRSVFAGLAGDMGGRPFLNEDDDGAADGHRATPVGGGAAGGRKETAFDDVPVASL
jgi:hypothetical protein